MTSQRPFPGEDSWGRSGAVGRGALWLTALTPALIVPGFFFPFVTTRNLFFRFCVELALAVILLVWFRRKAELHRPSDPILTWFVLYLIAIAIAAVAGYYPMHSLFGDFERMGGVWAWLHLLVFFLALRVLLRKSDWIVFFRIITLAADAIVIWGSFEYLPDRLRNPAFQTTLSTGSLIGNPGLLAPYLFLVLVISLWLVLEDRPAYWRIFAGSSCALMLVGIAGSLNRSAQLGLLTGAIVAVAVWLFLMPDRKKSFRASAIVSVLCIALLVLGYEASIVAPGVFSRLAGKWQRFLASPIDYSRTIQWKEAISGFADRPLIGYGPENYQIVTSRHFDPRIYALLGNGIFDRAHNAWLELLATSGLIGTVTMIGIWLAAAATLRRGFREKKLGLGETAIFSGALVGYAVYLTFWFFDINSVLIWVCILAFLAFRVYGRVELFAHPVGGEGWDPRTRMLATAVAAVTLLAAYLQGFVPLVAARRLAFAVGNAPFEQRLDAFQRVMDSPAPQTLHNLPLFYRFVRDNYRPAAIAKYDPMFALELDAAFKRGMLEADRMISRNPSDDRSYLDAARFAMLAGNYYRDPRYVIYAGNELQRAASISPKRPDTRILLASTFLTLADTVRASAQLDTALRWVPGYGPAYFYQGAIAIGHGKPDTAASLLSAAFSKTFVGYEDVYQRTVEALHNRGESARAAQLCRRYLEIKYGALSSWRQSLNLTPVGETMANRLPILYLDAGEPDSAIAAAFAFAAAKPLALPAARALSADLKSKRTIDRKENEFLVAPATLHPLSVRSPARG
jgi:O-antigen ligase/tetratricopeptide (TPR) repeat protein